MLWLGFHLSGVGNPRWRGFGRLPVRPSSLLWALRHGATLPRGNWFAQDGCGRARLDAAHIQDDNQRIGRIQQAFIKIRNSLERNQLRYSWFKVRNANGVGKF